MKLKELLHLAMHKYGYSHLVRNGVAHLCTGPHRTEEYKKKLLESQG
jgi:hypothetical protein